MTARVLHEPGQLVLLGVVVSALWAISSLAQPNPGPDTPATLIADVVYITQDGNLVAEGNVSALHSSVRLEAERIIYDPSKNQLLIDGPIRIENGTGGRILARTAELDTTLHNGLLSGARLVLNNHLQLVAHRMNRVGGRYTRLYKSAVTSCKVCDDGHQPLWQIRTRRVTHDQEERQIYFEGAQLRVLDVPVFYLPAMRLPDPTVDRASGFLIPSVRTTSQLGSGVRAPYFFTLGEHADLTLGPYLSPETRTLDFRYRQAFRRGTLKFKGAITDDTLTGDRTRGYLFGTGYFDLGNDFQLGFNIESTSDNAYLLDYGVTDADRLESQITITRTRRNYFIGASVIRYDSLRDSDDEDTLPTPVYNAYFEHRLFPATFGGEVRMSADVHQHSRRSDADGIGRDLIRATADVSYLRSLILPIGLRTDVESRITADLYQVDDDSRFNRNPMRITPALATTFRYPITRQTGTARQFLEPVAQVSWSKVTGDDVPNDASLFVEFDEGNLLAMSRFPGEDRIEDGLRMAYGVNWARFDRKGWQAWATFGQVLRADADEDFSINSGLSGTTSDFLLASHLRMDKGVSATARTLFNDTLLLTKAELRGTWIDEKSRLSGTLVWLDEDIALDRPNTVSEFWMDGTYNVSPNWTAKGNIRYDLAAPQPTNASVGLIYNNECVQVDLSLNRRFTSSSTVEPSTNFGFTIALRGFAVAAGTEKHSRVCS